MPLCRVFESGATGWHAVSPSARPIQDNPQQLPGIRVAAIFPGEVREIQIEQLQPPNVAIRY